MSGSAGYGSRFVLPFQQIVDPQGIPYVGATSTFYATGTSTLQSTYADVGLTVANPNPCLTNSAGMFGNIFLVPAPAYRVVIADPTGAVIGDFDPVGPGAGAGVGSVLVGMIMAYGGGTPPTGWLLCDGSAVSRTTFAPLYAVIGTAFGAGDGATTFAVPDLRGSMPVGKDDMGGVAANRLTMAYAAFDGTTIGAQGGDQRLSTHHHLITDPQHTHPDPGHVHYWSYNVLRVWTVGTTYSIASGGVNLDWPVTDVTGSAYTGLEAASTGITINDFGGGGSGNVQPSLVCLYIIFAG
jgi:microcystin-dependent protein